MKKKIAFLLTAIVLFSSFSITQAKAHNSCAHVLMVNDTLELYSQNMPHKRLPIASTTKIITAIVVLENTDDIKREVIIPREACGIEGSSIYLYEGEKITVEALLYGLLLESGNDAATALAIATAGSVEAFVSLMNNYVAELNLQDSHFTNPHGLDDKEHYSSAYDLAVIMKYAMGNEDFAKISSTKSISFDMPDGTKRFFSNHNRLLRMSENIIGGKTGFTTVSRRCLVSCAEKDGVRLICVTLDCADDFNRHLEMFNEAFSVYQRFDLPIDTEYTVDVVGADVELLDLKYEGLMKIVLRNESELDNISVKVHIPRFVYAPLPENSIIGEVKIFYKDVLVDSSFLISGDAVKATQIKSFISKVIDYIRRIFGK